MLPEKKPENQLTFFNTFEEQLDHKHPLYLLANKINWQIFEEAFSKHYNVNKGAPAKPIRLMVGLLILKYIRNLSDEAVIEQWMENWYFQFFCGEKVFSPEKPCEPSELIEFTKRIGKNGTELIFKSVIALMEKM